MDTVPPASLAQVLAAGPKYAYPPATKPIVNNIATKLLEDPRFYINVLHLMNKMDLPPPFTVKNLAPQQPTMITASMRTIDLQKGSNVTPIARPMVEATVMTLVDSDHGGQQTSQGLGQQGQKRKQTDDLLASDESEVESEPDEEQERKAMVAKIMKEGVMSPDAKGHANVAPKDPPPKPMADDTAQRTLDLEDVGGVSDQAPKEANENIHILNLDFKKTSRSDLVNIFARYFDPNEAILE
ncbi:hypothetical protein BG000_004983 [Podila horticola]|nr:hypothetical protein BG000_004983 [Podila horticola]